MKIISHNTWSFLKPRRLIMRPFAWLARCQDKSDIDQYAICDGFDLRVRFDEYGTPHFAHGLIEYQGDVDKTLDTLSIMCHKPFLVRVLLETTPFMCKAEMEEQKSMFYFFCLHIQNAHPTITFFGGWPRNEWGRKVYNFGDEPDYSEKHASVSGNKLNILNLKRWARENNKASIVNCEDEYIMLDFIEYR